MAYPIIGENKKTLKTHQLAKKNTTNLLSIQIGLKPTAFLQPIIHVPPAPRP